MMRFPLPHQLALCIALCMLLSAIPARAQFVDINANLTGVGDASLDWADYDGDGDPDLLIAGHTGSFQRTLLYQNNGGTFTEIENLPFIHIHLGEVAWGDYDADGDPDLILTGEKDNGIPTTQIYRNNGNGTFTDINAGVTGLEESMVDWGDWDNDGDLDFFIAGADVDGFSQTKIYRNNGNDSFVDIGYTDISGLRRGDGQWYDYDNDGDLDLTITGRDTGNNRLSFFRTNHNDSFVPSTTAFPGVDLSLAQWSDYNNNGTTDLFVAGTTDNGFIANIYDNPSVSATPLQSFEGIEFVSGGWVDYDGDGDEDLAFMGQNTSFQKDTRLYVNNGGILNQTSDIFPSLYRGDMDWADIDGDGDLDLAIAGLDDSGTPVARIFKQETTQNTSPDPPRDMYVVRENGNTYLQWTNGYDSESGFNLTYDVRVGTSPGASDILAFNGSGPGNTEGSEFIGQINSREIPTTTSTMYWSVLTVDEHYNRSFDRGEQVTHWVDDQFSQVSTNLPANARFGTWGDYDKDGDLDLLLLGIQGYAPGQQLTALYQNINGSFSEVALALPDVIHGYAEFADYDNDGDLDIFLMGLIDSSYPEERVARIYINTNGSFEDSGIDAGSPVNCSIIYPNHTLADIDNSGRLDFVSDGLGTLATADYNTDGRIDKFATGLLYEAQCKAQRSRLSKNTGEGFEEVGSLYSGWNSPPAWGDYDADGDMDLATSGGYFLYNDPGIFGSGSAIHRYDGNDTFATSNYLGTPSYGKPAWGDYDMDGDLDLILPGGTSALFENRGGTFVNILDSFDGVRVTQAKWGDYDNDDDLDVLINGTINDTPVTRIYTNLRGAKNDPPNTPFNLNTSYDAYACKITFQWTSAGDEETPTPGLTYNLRVGTSPGASDVLAPTALSDGTLLQPTWGNVYHNTSWTLYNKCYQTYYWSVQAVDGGFMGSSFAPEKQVIAGEQNEDVSFTDSGTLFTALDEGAAEWGDYNNDGHMDLLIVGSTDGNGKLMRIYENKGAHLIDSGIPFTPVDWAAAKWGDYDNDGDLDIIASGRGFGDTHETILYTNENGSSFTAHTDIFPGVIEGALDWGDYDNDGDLDLLLTGLLSDLNNFAAVYRNDNGTFIDAQAELYGIRRGGVAWIDYDTDGDLDIITTGRIDNKISRRTYLYRNDDGVFNLASHGLPAVDLSSVDWGDYDNDGDPDLVITGTTGTEFIARVYNNNEGSFTDINTGLPGVEYSSARWGDADNDGELDLLLSGASTGTRTTDVYINENGAFNPVFENFVAVSKSASAWGDYDNDGDLDAFVMGQFNETQRASKLYRNDIAVKNTAPTAPYNLSASVGDSKVTLSWNPNPPSDAETPLDAMGYNLRVGTSPGGGDIVSPPARTDGTLLKPAFGSIRHNTFWTLTDLPDGTYYWSVQAVDGNFTGSNFSGEAQFVIGDTEENPFSIADIDFYDLDEAAVDWGDYDKDGDLDLLIAGTTNDDGRTTRLYNNTGSSLLDTGQPIFAMDWGDLEWTDYDNDGDLDFIITGRGMGDSHNTILYTNEEGSFSSRDDLFPGVIESGVDWGDYDNDGDLDLLLIGLLSNLEHFAGVFQNNGDAFVDINAGLTGIRRGTATWVDYDVDGDLDIMTTGRIDNEINRRTLLYRNEGGFFTPVSHGLPAVDLSDVDWGDYDSDGDPDLVITGTTGSEFISRIYRNNLGSFTDVNAGLPGAEFSQVQWGDATNDGHLDLILTGATATGRIAEIYVYENGSFTSMEAGMIPVSKGATSWGDFDRDGDLDVFVTGQMNPQERAAHLYINNTEIRNTAPEAPGSFTSTIGLETVLLEWDQGSDEETPASGLTYALRLGTTPGGSEIIAPMADASGNRSVAQPGPLQGTNSFAIRLLKGGLYYWSVQTVDAGFMGSMFGPEQSFFLLNDLLPVELSYFEVIATAGRPSLRWETRSEKNNARFDIERSTDGVHFERIGSIEGQGTSNTPALYSYEDHHVPFGAAKVYYRLKQIDFDGQFAYSEVQLFHPNAPSKAQLIGNHPNPFNPTTRIRYEIPVQGKTTLTVFDATGKQVAVLVDTFQDAGRYEVHFDAIGLASGTYYYRLETPSAQIMRPMVLLK